MKEVVVDNHFWDGTNVPTTYIDFLGQEVKVGDFIVYATSNNSSAAMTLARFLEFKTTDAKGEPLTQYDWHTKTSQPMWKAKVQPLKDKAGWRTSNSGVHKPVVLNLTTFIKADGSRVDFVEPE